MTELNSLPPTRIKVINENTFQLDVDATGFQAHTGNGRVENVKVPQKVTYHSLKESINNPIASS